MPDQRRQYAKVYAGARANAARVSLREAARRLDISAVQVDGGSEFTAGLPGAA